MAGMLEHMKDKISNDESFVPAGIFAAMEKVTEGEAALQAKDAALQQVEEENAQMRERESSLKQQLATAEEKARIGAELEQQLLDERKKQKIMEVSAVVRVLEKAVFCQVVFSRLFLSLASQERLAELEEKEQAAGGSTEKSQQEKAKLQRSISRSALKRSNTERCPKTPFCVVFALKSTICQDRLRTNAEKV